MGVRRIFFRAGATSTFCLFFMDCWRRNADACLQTFYPFYTTNKMPYVAATVTKIALRWCSNVFFY